VAALNVEVGEVVGGTAGDAAIVLNTPNAVRLELTITESDLPNVKAGQTGVATFDALESAAFPIEIESVGLNPTSTQGVVTYQVRASINTLEPPRPQFTASRELCWPRPLRRWAD
jgi:multidrug resistance efflux pump